MSNESFGFFGSGAPYFGFPTAGTTITGTISEEPEVRQQTDFKTKEPATWPDGNPKLVLVVTLSTQLRDPNIQDDDGSRTVWIPKPSGMSAAVQKALKTAGASGFEVGGQLTLSYVTDGERTNPTLHPPKIFSAHYAKPNGQTAFHTAPPAEQPVVTPVAPAANGNGAVPSGLPAGMTPDVWATLTPETQAALASIAH